MHKSFIVAAALALPGAAHAVAFQNGSFEQGTNPGSSFISAGAGDSTTITGWTVGDSGVDYIGGLWTAQDGGRSLDMSQTSAGSISQTFDTVALQAYTVKFWIAGNGAGAPTVKTLDVLATGGTTGTYTFDTTGSTFSNMGWLEQSYSFTALGTSTTLTFTSRDNTAYGPALDNVSVTPNGTGAVPEPATWAMLMLGFGLVGAAARRRRGVALAA